MSMAFRHVDRWTASNTVPVLFVLGIIAILWLVYVKLHLMRLLQPYEKEVEGSLRFEGYVQLGISQSLLLLMMICFLRAVWTDPGSVPETDDWLPVTGPGSSRRNSASTFEVKQSGKRRFCQKCNKYKPDRCHHCRVCNSCVLRMDHHCPWIANCVGWGNHKYFFLLVLYAGLNCSYIVATMSSTLANMMVEEMETTHRFHLVFGMTVAWIMAVLLVSFFFFHCWLMTCALTTIEFCEKRTAGRGCGNVSFSHGLYENLRAVLGPRPLLWFLPLDPPAGDGLYFPIRQRMGVMKEPSDGQAAPEHSGTNASLISKAEVAASSSEPEVRNNEPEVTGERAAAE